MSENARLNTLNTGVQGLDQILGGGIPEFSFNIIGGAPGTGKTTLAHQMMFSMVGPHKRALYFSALGEPPIKMLRYQQIFSFFDEAQVEQTIRFHNLGDVVQSADFEKVLAEILREVKSFQPAFVFIDSFRSITRGVTAHPEGPLSLQNFTLQLGLQLTSWQVTSFLIGEYEPGEQHQNPIFTIADGILWLSHHVHGDSLIRKLQVIKLRGHEQIAGLHSFQISTAGLTVYPRALPLPPVVQIHDDTASKERLHMGVAELDLMLGGGLPAGYSMLLVGPSGSGKTRLAMEFLAEGARCGEHGVIATFEKRLSQTCGGDLDALIEQKMLTVLTMRSLDLLFDQELQRLTKAIISCQAKRLVFDSLSCFELALAPEFREDFREALYRLITELNDTGVTVLMTTEMEDRYNELQFSPYGNAFLVDAIVLQRYVEMAGQLNTIITVVKLRGHAHSRDLRLFEIGAQGIRIGQTALDIGPLLRGPNIASASQ